MSRTQLQTTMRNCQDLIGMIKNDDNMPEWVQSKITLSQDYISTVRDYLQSKEELGEGKVYDPFTKKMVNNKPIKVQAGGGATRNGVPVETGPSKYKTISQAYHAATAGQTVTPKQKLTKEEAEQLDELKKSTLASYVKKAHKDNALTANDLGHQLALSKRPGLSAGTDPTYTKGKNKYLKRSTGIDKAVSKLAKEEVMDEATTYKGIGTDVVDKKKVLNPPIPLTQKKKEVKDFKEGDEYDEKWKEYKGKSFKKESVMLKFNDFLKEAKKCTDEELVGKQHKLDKNHNGKLDSDDFKKLRGEELVGKQHKLDKNHNGKLDSDDFKKLRKEESEQIDELSKNTLNSYIDKAKHQADWAVSMKPVVRNDANLSKQADNMIKKRESGIGHAINKKLNKQYTKEESESIEESYPTKQHFEQMAALIKSHDDEKKRSDLAHHHACIFKGQNP
jgi:hypothetical protein